MPSRADDRSDAPDEDFSSKHRRLVAEARSVLNELDQLAARDERDGDDAATSTGQGARCGDDPAGGR